MEWISVEDGLPNKAPKGPTYVWAWMPDQNMWAGAMVVRWTGSEFKDVEDDDKKNVTHWMPLPKAPL